MKTNYRFGIVHYLNLYYVAFKQTWISIREYKANLYSGVLNHIIYLPMIYFGYIFVTQFGDVIGWGFGDYLLMQMFTSFPVVILGTFYWGQELRRVIPKGDLNKYLLRPGNIIANAYINLNEVMSMFIVFNVITFLPLVLYFTQGYTIMSILLSFVLSVYLGILFVLISLFYDSFNFYFLGYSKIIDEPMYEAREFLETFPSPLFKSSKIKFLFMLVPTYFVSTIVVPLFQNKKIESLWLQLFIISIISIVSFIGIIINWKLGLKKYEAYN